MSQILVPSSPPGALGCQASAATRHPQAAGDTLCSVGIDHTDAPLALRERCSLSEEGARRLLIVLHREHGCAEVFVLVTCLRVEIIAVGGERIAEALASVTGVPHAELASALHRLEGPAAVAQHLFSVAAGLKSLALGETQVTGQLKEAYRRAQRLGTVGPVLSQLVERALAVGGAVRSQTQLGAGVVSIPSLMAHMVRNRLGALSGKRAVIVGTGKVATLAAKHLAETRLRFVSRTPERARALAADFGGEAAAHTADLAFARDADLVVVATDVTQPLIAADSLRPLLAGGRQMLLADLCVPRGIDPAVAALPGCQLIDLDSMKSRCEAGRRRRAEASAEAAPIVQRGVEDFLAWWKTRRLTPTIQALLETLERLRQGEIDRLAAADGCVSADRVTRALMNKIAHGAIACLRRAASQGDAERTVEMIEDVFRLDSARRRAGVAGCEPGASSGRQATSPEHRAGPLTKRERVRRAIAGHEVDRPPVWMMRQAGRYLPEYRAVRERHDFLTLCRTPEAAAEVSLQPLEILDVDALIVFNDILIPLEAMGVPVVFTDQGPELSAPVRDRQSLAHFREAGFTAEEPVGRTLRLLRERAGPDVALLGFAGAPFTMAAYAVEGRLTRDLRVIKAMRQRDPQLLHTVLARLAATVTEYLRLQVEAGADMVQLFDTWAGLLTAADYREFALPYQRRVIDALRPLGVPIALYVKGSAPFLEAMAESGADVLSVDWTLPLSAVRRRVGWGVAIQGNLDPAVLISDPEAVAAGTRAMLEDAAGDGRHIANLGHGILPSTPVACARAFVQTVKEFRP